METAFGYQPLRLELFKQRIDATKAAQDLGVSYGHLRRCIIGRTRPCDALREKLPAYLGVPLTDLFTAEILEKPYGLRGVKR